MPELRRRAVVDPDDAEVGLRKAQEDHLPELTLAALRWARANDPDFPALADTSRSPSS